MIEENTQLKIETPGGWKASLFGIDTKIFLMLVVILLLAFWAYQLNEANVSREESARKGTEGLLKIIIDNQAIINSTANDRHKIDDNSFIVQKQNSEELAEMSYLLTLTPEQRQKLNIEMPYSLRKKLNNSGETK